jgi:hypothetical protein
MAWPPHAHYRSEVWLAMPHVVTECGSSKPRRLAQGGQDALATSVALITAYTDLTDGFMEFSLGVGFPKECSLECGPEGQY